MADTEILVEEEEEDFLADIQGEFQVQGQHQEEAKRRKEAQEGTHFLFSMPKVADDDGLRRATVRVLVPFKQCTSVLEHHKWKAFTIACPAEFGFPCEWCKRICANNNIARDELIKNAENLDKYGLARDRDFDTYKMRLIPVWHYEAQDGKGGVYLMAYKANSASPMSGIVSKERNNFVFPQEGYDPIPLTEYDLLLEQTGAEKTRTFQVQDRKPTPFKHQAEVDAYIAEHPIDKLSLRLAYAIKKAAFAGEKQAAYMKKLQDVRRRRSDLGGAKAKPVTKVAAPIADEDFTISLDFEDLTED